MSSIYVGLAAESFSVSEELQRRLGVFGNGSDGDVTISSGTTTLTRDMHYNNLTITGTGILAPSSYRIFVKGTLTVNSGASITRNGPSGLSTGTPGSAIFSGTLGSGGNGGASTSTTIFAGGSALMALGGAGGLGGTGASTAGAAAGSFTIPSASEGGIEALNTFHGLFNMATFNSNGSWAKYQSGSGGGGGGRDASAGGGGGAGASFIWIAAHTIVGNGSVSARGGNGGSPTTGNRGGGGGGGGGCIVLISTKDTTLTDITVSAAGGTGGTGSGTGTAGANGSAGRIFRLRV